MELNIVNEVAELKHLSIGQLRQRFAELFGEATAASNRTWLVKRIIWRLQALPKATSPNAPDDAPKNWLAMPISASMLPNERSRRPPPNFPLRHSSH